MNRFGRIGTSEGPFGGFFDQLFGIIGLSGAWILFSIPLVTAGASTTALYYTANKVLRRHRSYVFKEFWQSFRSNFKQSTIIWVIYLLLMALVFFDMWLVPGMSIEGAQIVAGIFAGVMILLTVTALYALIYTARFSQKTGRIIINTIIIAFCHPRYTLGAAAVTAAAVFITLLFIPAVLVTPGVAALLDSMILEKVFRRYMSEEDIRQEQML